MVVYPRNGRAEDLVRFEIRFLLMKVLNFCASVISLVLLLWAVCENYLTARVRFYELFDAIGFLSLLATLLCINDVLGDCKDLYIEAKKISASVSVKLIFVVFLEIRYLKAKVDDCVQIRGFGNPCNDKVDAVMESLTPGSPSSPFTCKAPPPHDFVTAPPPVRSATSAPDADKQQLRREVNRASDIRALLCSPLKHLCYYVETINVQDAFIIATRRLAWDFRSDDFFIVTTIVMSHSLFCCVGSCRDDTHPKGIQNLPSTAGHGGQNCSLIASLELLRSFRDKFDGNHEAVKCMKKIWDVPRTEDGQKKAGKLVNDLREKLGYASDEPLRNESAFQRLTNHMSNQDEVFGDEKTYKIVRGSLLGRTDFCDNKGFDFKPQVYLDQNEGYKIIGWIQGVNSKEFEAARLCFEQDPQESPNPFEAHVTTTNHSVAVVRIEDGEYRGISDDKIVPLRELPNTVPRLDVFPKSVRCDLPQKSFCRRRRSLGDCKDLYIEVMFHDEEIAKEDIGIYMVLFLALHCFCRSHPMEANPCNDKVDAVMESLTPESPSSPFTYKAPPPHDFVTAPPPVRSATSAPDADKQQLRLEVMLSVLLSFALLGLLQTVYALMLSYELLNCAVVVLGVLVVYTALASLFLWFFWTNGSFLKAKADFKQMR
ncbi:unnamed protein product, partial [Mesorhabditis belari]|uniref:Uncharacterized protein n=1 Tax=Mesorhabditis belari TaxID=2138241 RepID=A0AAF3EXC9_9BILA